MFVSQLMHAKPNAFYKFIIFIMSYTVKTSFFSELNTCFEQSRPILTDTKRGHEILEPKIIHVEKLPRHMKAVQIGFHVSTSQICQARNTIMQQLSLL